MVTWARGTDSARSARRASASSRCGCIRALHSDSLSMPATSSYSRHATTFRFPTDTSPNSKQCQSYRDDYPSQCQPALAMHLQFHV